MLAQKLELYLKGVSCAHCAVVLSSQLERQIQMQLQMRQRMIATQLSLTQERMYWWGGFTSLTTLALIAGYVCVCVSVSFMCVIHVYVYCVCVVCVLCVRMSVSVRSGWRQRLQFQSRRAPRGGSRSLCFPVSTHSFVLLAT